MNLRIDNIARLLGQGRRAVGARQTAVRPTAAFAAVLVLLSGCSWIAPTGSADGYAAGLNGAVAADEPQAALLARDILAAGGSAADAAVAAYFAMSVTYPAAASLGSGGACLVYDRARKVAEAIDFTHPVVAGRGPVPVPASPRGMLALHAKYGRLPWTQLVGPAEGMARIGHPVSRALARSLAAAPEALASPDVARIFADKSGNPVAEGGRVQQPDLAGTLGLIRRQPTRFYTGAFARRLADAYRAAGIDLSEADLRGFAPRIRPALKVQSGNQVAFLAPTPGGLVAAQVWAMLFREGTYSRASREERPHLVAEVSRRANADAGRWLHASGGMPEDVEGVVSEARIRSLLASYRPGAKTDFQVPGAAGHPPVPPDQGSASVVTADSAGQSVACAFTMNGAFGMARLAPGTGIMVARAPDLGRGIPPLTLMALGLGTQWQIELMGAGTGGGAAPVTMAEAAARLIFDRRSAEQIMGAPRLVAAGEPDRIVIEERHDARPISADLAKRGHEVVTVPSLGRLNLFVCPAGFAGAESRCDIRTDRRGFGFAQLY